MEEGNGWSPQAVTVEQLPCAGEGVMVRKGKKEKVRRKKRNGKCEFFFVEVCLGFA